AFEEGARLGWPFLAQQALTEMCAGIDVLRIAFQRGAIAAFGLCQFALLKVNIAQLKMMVGLIEMVNFGFQLFDSAPVVSSGQLEAPSRRRRRPINCKVVEQGGESEAHEDEKRPNPFASPDGVNEHPQAEQRDQREPGIGKP